MPAPDPRLPGPFKAPRAGSPYPPDPTAGRHAPAVEANARLTGATAAVVLALLALEGLTLLSITRLLTLHVFVGMLLVPPILVKMGSTFARFVNYYRGVPSYRAKGPPAPLLRLAGPLVVASTVVLLGSGIALLYVPIGDRGAVLGVHKATFVLWFGVMVVHVLGHILDTARLAPRDYVPTRRLYLRGAPARRLALGTSLVLGFLLGVAMIARADAWLR